MSIEKTILKARGLAKQGASSEARALYMSVLDKFPKNKRALEGIKALPDAGGVPDASAPMIRTLFNYYNSGRMKELVLATDEAVKVYPDHTVLLRLRAAGQAALGQAKEAIGTYNTIIALNPTDADAFGNRGNIQKTLG